MFQTAFVFIDIFPSCTITRDSGGFHNYSDLLFERPKTSTKQSDNLFDFDSIFSISTSRKSSSSTSYDDEDIFGGMPGLRSSASGNNDDMFASFASPPKQSSPVDDLLGNLGGVEAKSNSSSRNGSVKNDNDLIPGFGGSSPPHNGRSAGSRTNESQQSPEWSTEPAFISSEDPFVVLESISKPTYASSELFLDPLEPIGKPNDTGGTKLGVFSNSIPPLRPPSKPMQVSKAEKDFATGRVRNTAGERSYMHSIEKAVKTSATTSNRYDEAANSSCRNMQKGADDLESFFSVGSRSNSIPKSRATTLDSEFDAPIYERGP